MTNRRRQFREIEVLETLIVHQGAIIPCFRCRVALTAEDIKSRNIEKEHLHERELDGPDEPFNCRFSHKAKPCHATVTHGNGATFAGSSRHKIAKATQPKRIEKFVVRKTPIDEVVSVSPTTRCRSCGEYSDDCNCPIREHQKSFGRRSVVRA